MITLGNEDVTMVKNKVITNLVVALLVIFHPDLSAESEKTKTLTKDKAAASTKSTKKFSYRPPKRGAPAVRIGGGTRGVGSQKLELLVLAPDHMAITYKKHPTLYWYISESTDAEFELTVTNRVGSKPILEKKLTQHSDVGIQQIDLSKTRTNLIPGIEYRWFISATSKGEQRSSDVVSSGTIMRLIPKTNLKNKIQTANDLDLLTIYSENSVWYDLIDTLSDMKNKNPDDKDIREQYAALLQQVGLQSVANYTLSQ